MKDPREYDNDDPGYKPSPKEPTPQEEWEKQFDEWFQLRFEAMGRWFVTGLDGDIEGAEINPTQQVAPLIKFFIRSLLASEKAAAREEDKNLIRELFVDESWIAAQNDPEIRTTKQGYNDGIRMALEALTKE